jgi:anti-sigma factor RsiW
MSEIHSLSGTYAIDALNDLERAAFERHLANCDSCQAEVDSLQAAAAHLAETTAATPPADLRARILADAPSVRPLPPRVSAPRVSERGVSIRDESAQSRTWRQRIPAIAAAAALIAGIGAGATAIWQPWQQETVQLTLADRVRQAPDARTWTQGLPDGGQVTVTRSQSVGAALWETRGLKPAPSGRVYELWLQAPDESLKPAGLMSAGEGEVILRGDATNAIGAGLTEEPAGGSPAPTTDPLVFIDFRTQS